MSSQLPDPRLTKVYRRELNTGIFISVGGRQPGGVIYETDLVE